MKKHIFGVTAFIVILLSFFQISCPVDGPDTPINSTPKAIIVFDNTYGICTVLVYDDYRRRDMDRVAEIPAGKSSEEFKWTPSASTPFYFAYRISLKGVSGFTVDFIPEIGKDQKAVRLDADKRTVIPIPVLDDAVSNQEQVLSHKSYLTILNNSAYSFQLHRGVSMIRPDNSPASGVVNSNERAPYTINPGRSSDFSLLVGTDYKAFPASPERFEAGNFYSYQYNNDVSLNTQIPIKLDNINMPTYSVTFNANGGSGTVPTARTVSAASVITLPDGSGLSNGNRIFGGWGVSPSNTGIVYSAGTTYTVTGDITLYAKWYPAGTLYTVAFNSTGGNATASQNMASGAVVIRPPDPYRAGYTFSGWYRDSSMQTLYDFATPVTGNLTLYAAWSANRYTVTFNANGADGTAPAAVTADYGSNITLPTAGGLSKPDEPFRGWNTEDDGTGTAYASGAQYTVIGDVTLFAVWNSMPIYEKGYVTSGADSGPGTLRYAIENAPEWPDTSTIVIDERVGTIYLDSRILFYKNLTIEGNGVTITRSSAWTTIDDMALLTQGGSGVTAIRRIHFKGGKVNGNGGGAVHSSGNMTIESCIFSDNQAYGYNGSGAISFSGGGANVVKGCTFYQNAGPVGSAIRFWSSNLTLVGNLFYGNTGSLTVYKESSGTLVSNGYNVVDVPYGTGSNQSGWPAVIGDKNISELPFSTTTFRLFPGSGAANVIATLPTGYPTVDFYGNPIPASGAAAGAVQSQVSGSGYNLELSVNDASRGTVSTLSTPNQDGLFSGTVALTANVNTGYEFLYWLVDGEQSGSANPLPLTMSKYTKVQAVFGRVVLVTNFNDDMYSETTVGTLRNALANAQDWDIIRFNGVTPGTSTVALYDALPRMLKNITIEGNGITISRGASWATVDGNSLLSFSSSGMFVNVSRIHFKNGRSNNRDGAAAVSNAGIMIMESCIFSGNQGDYYWGGNVNNSGTLTMKGCTFYGNTTDYGGGGAIYSSGSLILIGNLFYENTSEYTPILYYWKGTVVSNGYNVADVGLGEEYYKTGWEPAPTDTTFSDLNITGTPINTTTFAPVSGLNSVIPNPPPQGFPATDFYGNARTFPGAPGAVK